MRLARPLLKIVTVLIVAAAAFGGAVALASTLFERPPSYRHERTGRLLDRGKESLR